MNKKFLSILITAFILINASGIAFAEKKDVGDPVLREVINELSRKMPRFINKYGDSVFVADEQITRGTLLQALYEYDKMAASPNISSSVSAGGVVSKKDYEALNAKVALLEKKMKTGSMPSTSSEQGKKTDFVELMGDLETNMPVILDNTLSDSKVFKALAQKVDDVRERTSTNSVLGGAGVNVHSSVNKDEFNNLKNTVIQMNQNYAAIDKKLSDLQKESSLSTSKIQTASSQSAVSDLKKNIDEIKKKIGDMETSMASAKTSAETSTTSSKTTVEGIQKSLADLSKKVNTMEMSMAVVRKSGTNKVSAAEMANGEEIASIKGLLSNMDKKIVDLEKSQQNVSLAASNLSSSGSNVSQSELAKIQRNITDLNKKFNDMEMSFSSVKNSAESSNKNIALASASAADSQAINSLKKDFQKEMESINKKVSAMEQNLAKKSVTADDLIYSGYTKEDFNSLRKSVEQMNKNYVAINKKLDSLEKDQQYLASGKSSSDSSLSSKQLQAINAKINSIRQSVDDIKSDNSSSYSEKNTADIKRIEKRLSSLEHSDRSSVKSSDSSSGSSGSSKTGTVAKISLGLSLVAMLFVAR